MKNARKNKLKIYIFLGSSIFLVPIFIYYFLLSGFENSYDSKKYSQEWALIIDGKQERINLPTDLKLNDKYSSLEKVVLVKKFDVEEISVFEDAGVVLGRIGDTTDVFLNDCKIVIENTENYDGWKWGGLRYGFIDPVCIQGSEFNIRYEINHWGFAHKGVFSGPFGFGEFVNIKKSVQILEFFRFDIFLVFGLILLVSIFIFYFYNYLLLKERVDYLYYSLFSLFAGLYQICVSTVPYKYFGNGSFGLYLNFLSSFLALYFMIQFYRSKYNVSNNRYKYILYLSGILFFISLFFTNLSTIFIVYHLVMIMFLISLIHLTILISKKVWLKNSLSYRYESTFVIALYIFISFALLEFYFGITHANQLLFTPFGYIILFSITSLSLAKEYADAFLYVEEQVEERTQDLNTALEDLKGLEKMKERFFANISHDLKTPITVAMGALEEASERYAATIGGVLAPAERALYKLRNMVGSILDSVKAESGTLQLQWESAHVPSFLKPIAEDTRVLCKRNQVEFVLEADGYDGLTVPMDADKMQRVMENILSNAVKYTKTTDKPTKKVAIHIETDQSNLHIYVDDSGIGVPEEERDKVFERFVQSSRTDLKVHGGSGIGLSFVKEVIDLHNGEVTMQESPWGGSRVHIQLPLSQDVTLTEKEPAIDADTRKLAGSLDVEYPPTRPAKIDPAKYIILSCEDNPEVAQIIYTTLMDRYNVYFAENGEEGWKLLESIQPDCIVSDIQMPVLSGLGLLEKIRDRREYDHIPFIFLTSLGADQDIIDGFRLGATDYIAKPFRKEVLRTRVLAHIERKIFFERLTRSEKMSTIGTMFAGIAHEMKNPLQSLVNNHSMIEKIIKDKRFEDKYDALERAITAARKKTDNLTHLVSSVNEYSSGSENKTEIDLKAKVSDALLLLENKRKEKDFVTIDVEQPEGPVTIQGYNSIMQALTNIIGNALDAIEKTEGKVSVTLEDGEEQVVVKISDNGPGIPKKVLPYVFDPFVTTKDPDKGTGLGLFLTRSIVEERHGGEVRVDSEVGKGTTFTLYLPKVAPDMHETSKPFHR